MHLFRITGLALIVGSLFLLQGCMPFLSDNEPKVVLNTSKGKTNVNVEIADTFDLRKRGLMFRPSLADNHGMFFVFDKEQPLSFWMKNTLIPLDMVFIGKDYKVVNVAKNVPPCKTPSCETYKSKGNAQYVLEVKGGSADLYGLQPGDKIDWVNN